MFRFLEILTNTQGLRPFYTSNRSAISTILRIYHKEINGATKMTFDNMHWALEAYLYRRGFRTKEDIIRLEKLEIPWCEACRCLYTLLIGQKTREKAHSSDEHSVRKEQRATTYRRGIFEQDQLSTSKTLYPEINKASSYAEYIHVSSKSKEAEAKVEDQTVEESPVGDSYGREDFKKDKKKKEARLVPATEDELKGAAAAIDHEIFGTADSQEMAQIEDLVAEKEDVAELGEEGLTYCVANLWIRLSWIMTGKF